LRLTNSAPLFTSRSAVGSARRFTRSKTQRQLRSFPFSPSFLLGNSECVGLERGNCSAFTKRYTLARILPTTTRSLSSPRLKG
jgi:hypothetical protein